jgi:Fe2+ transport system protein FeoA
MTPPSTSSSALAHPAAPPLTLVDFVRGEEGVVVHVSAKACDVERLAALGLAAGAHVKVLRTGRTLTVAVGESRFALGRAWAHAVSVVRV